MAGMSAPALTLEEIGKRSLVRGARSDPAATTGCGTQRVGPVETDGVLIATVFVAKALLAKILVARHGATFSPRRSSYR